MEKPKVSVVIPMYNAEKYMEKCLQTISNQTYKSMEVILVDNACTDNTATIAKKFPFKIITKEINHGPGLARNLGVEYASGDILVFVDSDMYFDKDFIKNLVKPIVEEGAVGTNYEEEIVANKENIWARCWGRRLTTFQGEFKIYRAILKSAFEDVNGFDPNKDYGDDQSLFEKLKIRPVLAKNAIVYHNNPDNLKKVFAHNKWIGRSSELNILKSGVIGPVFVVLCFILTPLIVLYKTLQRIFSEFYFPYLIYYPIFGFVKYFGMFAGMLQKSLTKKNLNEV